MNRFTTTAVKKFCCMVIFLLWLFFPIFRFLLYQSRSYSLVFISAHLHLVVSRFLIQIAVAVFSFLYFFHYVSVLALTDSLLVTRIYVLSSILGSFENLNPDCGCGIFFPIILSFYISLSFD